MTSEDGKTPLPDKGHPSGGSSKRSYRKAPSNKMKNSNKARVIASPSLVDSSLSDSEHHSECLICTEPVFPSRYIPKSQINLKKIKVLKSGIWGCRDGCFKLFHFECIKSWVQKCMKVLSESGSRTDGSTSLTVAPSDITVKDGPLLSRWTCPNCRHEYNERLLGPTCFCGKSDKTFGFSCGKKCGRLKRQSTVLDSQCRHPCKKVCHQGPCEEVCNETKTIFCFGFHMSKTLRCSEIPNQVGVLPFSNQQENETVSPVMSFSCGRKCGKILGCSIGKNDTSARHYCELECHSNKCASCPISTKRPCSGCHLSILDFPCGINELFCQRLCNEYYSCRVHRCDAVCHYHVAQVECPFSPTLLSCFCGKVITSAQRKLCTDSQMTCKQICGKLLKCGHFCDAICHSGDCKCNADTEVSCRCGSQTKIISCADYSAFSQDSTSPVSTVKPFLCTKKCPVKMFCGKHICQTVCCPYSKLISAQQPDFCNIIETILPSTSKKTKYVKSLALLPTERPSVTLKQIENALEVLSCHICSRDCGRLLDCKKHACTSRCHIASLPVPMVRVAISEEDPNGVITLTRECFNCLEASFEEYLCPCKFTRILPPLPCGFQAPECPGVCPRKTEKCFRGHVLPKHKCHNPDTVDCETMVGGCKVPVDRYCACPKRNRLLPMASCSSYTSERSIEKCWQVCGVLLDCGHFCPTKCHTHAKSDASVELCRSKCSELLPCGHICGRDCHYPNFCPGACEQQALLSCECGFRTEAVTCSEFHRLKENRVKTLVFESASAESSEATNGANQSALLPCDADCLKQQRLVALRTALNVQGGPLPSSLTPKTDLSFDVLKYCVSHKKWATAVSTVLYAFLSFPLSLQLSGHVDGYLSKLISSKTTSESISKRKFIDFKPTLGGTYKRNLVKSLVLGIASKNDNIVVKEIDPEPYTSLRIYKENEEEIGRDQNTSSDVTAITWQKNNCIFEWMNRFNSERELKEYFSSQFERVDDASETEVGDDNCVVGIEAEEAIVKEEECSISDDSDFEELVIHKLSIKTDESNVSSVVTARDTSLKFKLDNFE